MTTRAHPTHHDRYHPGRALWGVIVGVGGVFVDVFLLMWDTTESSGFAQSTKVLALWAGALAFVGGTLLACVTEVSHRFTRCPSCARLLVRRRIDYQRSYYPCRRCDVTWTCACHKLASAEAP